MKIFLASMLVPKKTIMCTATAERNFMYTQKTRKKHVTQRKNIMHAHVSRKNEFLLPERVHKIYTYAKLTIPNPSKVKYLIPKRQKHVCFFT